MTTACPFCGYAARRFPPELLVYEDEHVLVVPSLRQKPGNRGHCLVAPREHVRNVYDLPVALAGPLLLAVSAAARAARHAFSADGVSVRQNNESAGGQDVFHLHVHVIPRYVKDDFEMAGYERIDECTRIVQARALEAAWPR